MTDESTCSYVQITKISSNYLFQITKYRLLARIACVATQDAVPLPTLRQADAHALLACARIWPTRIRRRRAGVQYDAAALSRGRVPALRGRQQQVPPLPFTRMRMHAHTAP